MRDHLIQNHASCLPELALLSLHHLVTEETLVQFGSSFMQKVSIWKKVELANFFSLSNLVRIRFALFWYLLKRFVLYPIDEQHELLKKSQAEQDSLLQELHNAKQCCEETQVKVVPFSKFL